MRRLKVLLLLGCVLLGASVPAVSVHSREVSSRVCLEDQPCWDCTVMGNEICGKEQH